MKTRVISGIVGIIILLAAITQFHTWTSNAIIFALYAIGIHEIHNVFKDKNVRATEILLDVIGFLMIIVTNYYTYASFLPVAAFAVVGFAFIVVFNFDNISFTSIASEMAFGIYTLIGFYSILRFKLLLPYTPFGWDGAFLFLIVAGIAWGGDTCAYFSGYLFGKNKLAPTLSPKKTKEGAVGGILGSVVISWIFTFIYCFIKPILENSSLEYEFSLQQMIAFGVIAAMGFVVGIVGDLFASAVKRQAGIKDYGNLMPGHGGVMDRFDSVLLVAPIVSSFLEIIVKAGGIFYV